MQNSWTDSFQSALEKEDLIAKMIKFFPYPIQVFDTDGTSVMVNQALLEEYHIHSDEQIVGKYNIFKDPTIATRSQLDRIKRAFQGETAFFTDIRVPLEYIFEQYGVKHMDFEAVYQDITLFPILSDGQVSYVVALLVNRRVYFGKNEISKAKEYMESHWLEKFDIGKTAKAVGLSKAYFTRLFKKHTGMTPHEYYISYKINRLKEELEDTNLSISQVFANCGVDYNGHFARVFKDNVGMTPSQYRRMINSD